MLGSKPKFLPKVTLHLRWVNSSHSLVAFLLLLILVDPLVPVDLNVLVLLFVLGESGPETQGFVLLIENEQEMEASLVVL